MTDSVSKSLKIQHDVADTLQSNYQLTHLLCKTHLAEAFDPPCNGLGSSVKIAIQGYA